MKKTSIVIGLLCLTACSSGNLSTIEERDRDDHEHHDHHDHDDRHHDHQDNQDKHWWDF